MTQPGVLTDRPHLWAFVVGCVAVTAGVVMHLPMFWMGRFHHFRQPVCLSPERDALFRSGVDFRLVA